LNLKKLSAESLQGLSTFRRHYPENEKIVTPVDQDRPDRQQSCQAWCGKQRFARMNPPLGNDRTRFRSRDLDEARERVAAVCCPHRLETLGARSLFDARHHRLPGQRLWLN